MEITQEEWEVLWLPLMKPKSSRNNSPRNSNALVSVTFLSVSLQWIFIWCGEFLGVLEQDCLVYEEVGVTHHQWAQYISLFITRCFFFILKDCIYNFMCYSFPDLCFNLKSQAPFISDNISYINHDCAQALLTGNRDYHNMVLSESLFLPVVPVCQWWN